MNRLLRFSWIGAIFLIVSVNAHAVPIDAFQGGRFIGTIDPFSGLISNARNYSYSSNSAHTIHGPTPTQAEMQFFFYDGSDGLGFFMVFGKDLVGGGGLVVDANIAISGSSLDPRVMLSDDVLTRELTETAINDRFQGRWRFDNNSDGGVLGPLGGTNWEIVFDPISIVGMEKMIVYGSGARLPLRFSFSRDPAIDDRIVFRPHPDDPEPVPGVPEPATLWLTGLGLVGLSRLRRRRA